MNGLCGNLLNGLVAICAIYIRKKYIKMCYIIYMYSLSGVEYHKDPCLDHFCFEFMLVTWHETCAALL